jgi:pilus assembly protein CpaF
MFTIVISEKGGAERRETFEKSEISVGRVQGNDLMLPKGNVSKHHARILSRDARFIVTDLKSTNGTYVNGRKTSQATIVREGDKIYIGDFVLRVETGQGGGAPDSIPRAQATSSTESSAATPALVAPSGVAAGGAGPPAQPSLPPIPQPRPQELSHYPLERDPDSESAPEVAGAAPPQVPGPPRIPQTAASRPRPLGAPPLAPVRPGALMAQPRAAALAPTPVREPAFAELGRRESRKQSGRRVALITLVDRVADVVDLSPLERSFEIDPTLKEQIERAVREQAKAMRSDGEAPDDLDLDQLAVDAVRELVALGPIGPALEDDEVSEIHVTRSDLVVVKRKGERVLVPDVPFTSEEAVARIVGRLAHQAGEPIGEGENVVERCLPSGAGLVAIGPPITRAWALTIRKRRRVDGSIEDLVRTGAMSRPMADFLVACVRARCNMLVVGSSAGTASAVLAALAAAAPTTERVAVFQDEDEIALGEGQVLSMWPGGRAHAAERVAAVAARFGSDRLVIGSIGSPAGLASLDAIGEGSEGVLAGYAGPTLRRGLARLAARVSLARPGISIATAREVIATSFDVGIEVGRDLAGTVRIQRIAEFASADGHEQAVRDIFVSSLDGAAVSFSATGTPPRLTQDFASRGIQLDAATFARPR